MSDQTLTITFVPDQATATGAVWVRLEQVVPAETATTATLADVHALWLTAATGRSAQLLRSLDCPVSFAGNTITIYLGFYIWPSALDLPFQLTPAMGTITGQRRINRPREFSLFVNNQDRVDLDFYMEDISVTWDTPTFDRYGAAIAEPTYELVDGTILQFSTSVFGAIRVTGSAAGFYAVCAMDVEKALEEVENTQPVEPLVEGAIIFGVAPATVTSAPKIEDLENTITATWIDNEATQTDQLRLILPGCVAALLAMCPDDRFGTRLIICLDASELLVYYNACTGEVIAAFEDEANQTNFCSEINSSDPGPNPWGLGTFT